ncbi:isoform X1 [Octopus vulgaris]|uniref:Isoform X1 n=1 Tax=Octopus vulgaris TaxID=6645 RepID=A0AA36FD70_OCTVU|nr:isoform X1 [Octopus vulgaris]
MHPLKRKKSKRTHGVTAKRNAARWKRGQSCTSNPTFREHRDRVGQGYTKGNSGLTEAAVAKLNAANSCRMDITDNDSASIGKSTYQTFVTNFTECTNTTFGNVHRLRANSDAVSKEIAAVLAAVTEVIKENDGKETDTEYFAALVTALDTMDIEDGLTATLYLLGVVISKVPDAVLINRFSEVSKKLLDILVKHSDGDNTSMVKSLLRCLSYLLCAQTASVWELSSTQQIYLSVLAFITHKKPKIRKLSHECVEKILKKSAIMKSDKPPNCHPMAPPTAKHCIKKIEESGGGSDAVSTLHVLMLVKQIFPVLAQSDIQALCEAILKVMTLATPLVVACSMQCLYGLVSVDPSLGNLGSHLNAQLITALYDYQPLMTDVQPSCAWMTVMEKSIINLCKQDIELGQNHLPKLVTTSMKYLLVENPDVQQTAAGALQNVFKECVSRLVEAKPSSSTTDKENVNPSLQQVVKTASTGLNYQYHTAWKHIISVLTVMLEVAGGHYPDLMKPALSSLSNMRDSPDFKFNSEIDQAIGSAIKYMGPKNVLEIIPLQVTGDGRDLDFPRSWLVPVLKKYISNTELEFFRTYFMPLSKKLQDKSIQYEAEGNTVAAKTYGTLVVQFWSLLPSFCNNPTDLKTSFRNIARSLGSVVNDRPQLRTPVLSSLRKLIYTNLENEENRNELAHFAKNFLPILFNLYTQFSADDSKDPLRLTIFETARAYIRITPTQLLQQYIDTSMKQIEEKNDVQRCILLDLCILMTSSANNDQVKSLFQLASSNLKSSYHSLQKKCYRLLEEIFGNSSEASAQFVNQELTPIKELLVTSLSTSALSSKGPRLRCLLHVVKKLEKSETDFIQSIIPEAILCTRETGSRARRAAYTLLTELASTMIRCADKDAERSTILTQYFHLLFAGLGGTPVFICASLQSLSCVIFDFKDDVTPDLIENFVEHCCVLLMSRTHEIVKATLSYLQVLLTCFSDLQLGPYLEKIMSTLVVMKDGAKQHFRFKTKMVYTKLIRRFGYKAIYDLSSDSIRKVLTNIQKLKKNKKKKKEQSGEVEDDKTEEKDVAAPAQSIEDILTAFDSDNEEDDDNSSKKKKKKKKKKGDKSKEETTTASGAAWLKENTDDNITDFMDVSAARSISTTKPSKPGKSQQTSRSSSKFDLAPDGRLLINQEDDDDEKDAGSSDGEDSAEEVLKSMASKMKSDQSRKRKRPSADDTEHSESKYVAGGHGIHRPKASASKRQEPVVNLGSEYKSKKAGGDVKRQGKPDPYAYIQLKHTDLNKRKRSKMKGKFKGLLDGAKKGATKGLKLKSKGRK